MLVKKLNFQHGNVSATLMYFKGLSDKKFVSYIAKPLLSLR